MKSFIATIVVLAIVGFLGYYAFTTLQTGSEFAQRQEQNVVQEEQEIEEILLSEIEEEFISEEVEEELTPEQPEDTGGAFADLKNDLQKLLDQKAVLEPGDSGAAVLTIQKFLNIYDEELNLAQDRDFGSSTRSVVEKFQKDNNLYVDGGIGPKTLQKMIDFLEK